MTKLWLSRFVLALLVALGMLGTAPPVTARPPASSYIGAIAESELPPEAAATLKAIRKGGPFPFRRDGIEFQNRERRLPQQPRGYYHEYTVITPNSNDRGARRMISGAPDEFYYTADHYRSFRKVRP